MDTGHNQRTPHVLQVAVGPASRTSADEAPEPAVPDRTVGAATAAPTVSVIVCTYNRPAGLRRALASVWRQDVRDVEVIVVDDGSDDPVRLPEPPHGELRLIRTEHRGVGAARAVGLATARGVFVAYCDDDDEWTPDHLATLLAYLLEHPDVALIYGDAAWTDAEPLLPDGVSYSGPWLGEANQIRATDVLHRASAARDVGGFDPLLRAYEDLDLWRRMEEAHVLRHLPVVVATHSLHAGRVTACDHPQERERLARYYERSLPSGGRKPPGMPTPTSFDPATWQPGRRELVWQSALDAVTSFGLVGRQLVLAAERAGIDVMMAAPEGRAAFPEFARFFKPLDGAGRIGFSYRHPLRSSPLPAALVVIYAPWETTLVPKARVDAVNREAVLLYVPCRQNLESFRNSGIRIPIKVLHHGVDPARFPYLARPRTGAEPFTFGTFGNLSPRKGVDVLIRAFRDEFTPHEPVRLLLKSWLPVEHLRVDDPRIMLSVGFWKQTGLLEFLRQLDAFVLPSRGEGFGLCGLEAMATGLPIIATNWSGPAQYLDPADSFPLAYRLADAASTEAHSMRFFGHSMRFFGQWAEPDYEHLRSLLRWIYEHTQEAMRMGQLASARVHRDWTWDRVAHQLRDDCDLLARGVTPW